MSDDYKAAFRAAQAQRGLSAKTTKETIRALKAKKQSAATAGTAAVPRALSAQQQQQQQQQPAAAAGPPAGFFDAKQPPVVGGVPRPTPSAAAHVSQASLQSVPHVASTSVEQQQQQQLAGTKRAANTGTADAGGITAAVPQGFFDDRAADKRARGIKEPDKLSKEAAFAEFAAAMDDQLKEQAAEEAAEAAEAALEQEERDAFEQRLRMQRAARIKALKHDPSALNGLEVDATITSVVPAVPPRRKPADVLREILGEDEDEEDNAESQGDEGDGVDGLLDWRAKGAL